MSRDRINFIFHPSPFVLSSQKTYVGKFEFEEDDHWEMEQMTLVVYDGKDAIYRKPVWRKNDKMDQDYVKTLLKAWQKEYAPDMKIIYED